MINDLKLGFKLLRYSMQFKMSIIGGALFILIGFVFDMTFVTATNPIISTTNPFISTYYLFSMVFASQLVSNLNASQMVQSSPYKKCLQTKIMTGICVCMELITVTIMLVVKAVQYYSKEHMQIHVIDSILVVSIAVFIFHLYMVMATKFYWPATIGFMIVCCGSVMIITKRKFEMGLVGGELAILPQISFFTAVVICYGAILLSGILTYVIANLLYKREYSKMMFKVALERAK